MFSFPISQHVVMACLITGVYDVNRSETLPNDDYALIKNWAESLANLRIQGIIFHNNFTKTTCEKHGSQFLRFIKINHSPQFNPNVYRYFVYRDFLQTYAQEIKSVFVTDISDVVVVQNPFIQPLFGANLNAIFCGDEPKSLSDEWMKAHATHLRSKIAGYESYEEQFKNEALLNCGIIGGNLPVMQGLIEKLCLVHEQYNYDNQTAYTGDMGAFNYLVRTQFNAHCLHGPPINTEFKAYQSDRTDCWFRHK